MAYLDDILKGTRKVNNNVQTLGSYSPLTGFNNEDEFNSFIQTDINGEKYFPVYRTRNPALGTTQPVGYIPLDSLTIKRYGPTGRV